MEVLQNTVIAVLVVSTVLLFLAFFRKRRYSGKWTLAMNAGMITLTSVYAGYSLVSSTETMRAYWFVSLFLGIAAAIQVIKTGAANLLCGEKMNEK